MIITIYLGFSLDHLWIYTKVEEHISLPWKQWFISLVHLYKKSERLREAWVTDLRQYWMFLFTCRTFGSTFFTHVETPVTNSFSWIKEQRRRSCWTLHQVWNTFYTVTKLGATTILVIRKKTSVHVIVGTGEPFTKRSWSCRWFRCHCWWRGCHCRLSCRGWYTNYDKNIFLRCVKEIRQIVIFSGCELSTLE